jgi:hypothetical protein
MAATQITIPHSFTDAIKEIANEARFSAVQALAVKYGFDPSEALEFLGESEPKLVQKRGSGPKNAKAKPKDAEAKPKAKRPPTGYLIFSKENREQTRQDLSLKLGEGEKLKPQLVVKELAARWAALGEEEREAWKEQAAMMILEDNEGEE